jgi:ribose 1,5-bisphosphokinase
LTGALVYAMGPSGAGKDTLLKAARDILEGHGFAFANRYITRPLVPDDEIFVPLSRAAFAERKAANLFAFDWHARDIDYAIGREIELWRAAGLTVVVSGSRAHFAGGAPSKVGAIPLLIDASPAALAARLAARGREPATEIAARLARGAALDGDIPGAIRIDNSGVLADAVAAFVAALRNIRAKNGA